MTFRDKNIDTQHDLARARNIAENGRWGTLAMTAVAIAADDTTMAFYFALVLLIAYVVELLEDPLRAIGSLALAAWTLVLVIALVVRLSWA